MELSLTQTMGNKMQKTRPGCFLFTWSTFFLFAVYADKLLTSEKTSEGRQIWASFKAESSDWQEAHPGRVPIRRCGDESLPSAAQGLGLAVRDPDAGSRLVGLEEGGPGSSQKCLKGWETIDLHTFSPSPLYNRNFFGMCVWFTSDQLSAYWRCPGCWWGSGWTQFVMGEQVVQLGWT